jgi:hypothetical protein
VQGSYPGIRPLAQKCVPYVQKCVRLAPKNVPNTQPIIKVARNAPKLAKHVLRLVPNGQVLLFNRAYPEEIHTFLNSNANIPKCSPGFMTLVIFLRNRSFNFVPSNKPGTA